MFFSLIWRTLILYVVIVVTMRLMGKRQIGQLQPYEFAVAVMISELAAIPLTEDNRKIHHALIPIAVLLACQLFISFVSLKGVKLRNYICGRPVVLIKNGHMLEKNMRKEFVTINDLLEQLRFSDVTAVDDVEFAVLETNGQLSVLIKSQKRAVTPEDLKIKTDYERYSTSLIIDGKLISEALKELNIDHGWLLGELKKYGVNDIEMVFYASLDSKGKLYVQKKGEYLQ